MSLSRKAVTPLCRQIAAEHDGWRYVSEAFKNTTLKHSTLYIYPFWALQLSAQPKVILTNKKVNKLYKQYTDLSQPWAMKEEWISKTTILAPGATQDNMVYQKLVFTLEEAEVYIRDFFARGLAVIEKHYAYCNERELLENMPVNLEQNMGIGYCLSRVVLHDFDFVRRYVNDEIPTNTPKDKEIEDIKRLLPVWEKNYQETGSVFAK